MTTATLPEETGDSITATAAVFEDRRSQLLQDVERYRARERYRREHIEPARATP